MAHFAELDENNIVLRVIVVNNSDLLDENGQESEAVGIAYCKRILGENTNWVQTSYNANFRKYYAGPGFKYDPVLDEFVPPVPPAPYPSWIYDEEKKYWKAPIDPPTGLERNQGLKWNEETGSWEIVLLSDINMPTSDTPPTSYLTDPNNPYFVTPVPSTV